MLKIFKYLSRKDWVYVALCLLFILLAVYCDLAIPGYMSEITKLVQTEGSAIGDVYLAGGMMLLYALLSLGASFTVAYFACKVAASLARRLRGLVFDKTLSFSMEEMNRFSTASLITRSTNDVTQIQTLIAMGLQAIIKAPITAVWAVTKILGKSWQWTAVTGGGVVILLIVIAVVILYAVPRFKKVQRLTDNLNLVTRENLTGLRVVRAYNGETYQEKKFERANAALTDTNLQVNRTMALISPTMSFIMSALTLGVYVVGAFLIDGAAAAAQLTLFSDMVVFSSYAAQIIMAFMMLVMIFILLPRASVSAGRINEVLDTEPTIADGGEGAAATAIRGEVEFQNVSFRYPGAAGNALTNISFKAGRGETVAFIGATGSGKSTLINLIPRFYDATEGAVLVDGVDVRSYAQAELREKLGYVSQTAVLFSGTIKTNVAYGGAEGDDGAVMEALDIAQGRVFTEGKPEGVHAPVAQGGANFSGGQKQRVSIARAIYKRPEIYLFDDAFSALDYKTDRKLRGALKGKAGDTTRLIVAQRIGTIRDADKIIVLDEGRLVGMGTHEELLENCGVYREIALSQLSKEELSHG